ncbi:hypothetical protein C8R45DRAFT_1220661 [Mycena sanguinolenta]|nr:hypothetical protein C8R45DRAFT_1220661 [Mycena sanguinolenta]
MAQLGNGNPAQSATRAVSLDGKTISVPDLPIKDFCENYRLDEKIEKLLKDQAFDSAGALLEVSEEDLRAVGFKLGQVAELKRALREWLDAVQSG